MPNFTIINRQSGKEEKVSVDDKDAIVIGRHHGCDLVLKSKTVSRKHAEIVRKKHTWYLADLESGNGTLLNGEKLKPREKTVVKNGDVIRIEEFEIRPVFEERPFSGSEDDEHTDSGVIEIKMIKKVLSSLDSGHFPTLEGLSPPAEGKRVVFADDISELVVGRDADCHFQIDTNVVSRRHAVFQKKWGGITVTDLKSKNGTFIDGQRIEEKKLKDGDVIVFGNIKVMFKNPQEIDMEALTRDYEKKEEVEAEPEKKKEKGISDEAKISVEPEKPLPPPPPKPAPKPKIKPPKTLSHFSLTELILMGTGVVMLLFALVLLSLIL